MLGSDYTFRCDHRNQLAPGNAGYYLIQLETPFPEAEDQDKRLLGLLYLIHRGNFFSSYANLSFVDWIFLTIITARLIPPLVQTMLHQASALILAFSES